MWPGKMKLISKRAELFAEKKGKYIHTYIRIHTNFDLKLFAFGWVYSNCSKVHKIPHNNIVQDSFSCIRQLGSEFILKQRDNNQFIADENRRQVYGSSWIKQKKNLYTKKVDEGVTNTFTFSIPKPFIRQARSILMKKQKYRISLFLISHRKINFAYIRP